MRVTAIQGQNRYDIDDVDQGWSVDQLKTKIEDVSGESSSRQRLLFKGKELKDNRAEIGKLGVTDGAKVMVLLKPSGISADSQGLSDPRILAIEQEVDKYAQTIETFPTLSKEEVAKNVVVVKECLIQLMLKLDGIDSGGSENVRLARKAQIQRIQSLNKAVDKWCGN